jgi:cytochrome c6
MQDSSKKLKKWMLSATVAAVAMAGGAGLSRVSAAPASGADMFKAKCASCHGADGSGSTTLGQRMKVRDLRSPEVQKQTDDELAGIIGKGKAPMPAYSKTLSPDEIRQLVAYLRTIASKS